MAAVLEPWSSALQDASKVMHGGTGHGPVHVPLPASQPAPPPPIPFVGGMTLPVAMAPQPLSLAVPKPKWYRHPALLQALLVVAVFLVTWVVFAAIRPPFTNDPKKRHGGDKCPDSFSPAKGAGFAALCALILVACMVAFAFIFKKKKATTG